MKPSPSSRLVLASGTHQSLYLAEGTPLHVLSGSILLVEPPRWLGETTQRLTRCLRRGESHVLTQRGWVQLRCEERAVITLANPRPAPAPVGARRILSLPGWARGA